MNVKAITKKFLSFNGLLAAVVCFTLFTLAWMFYQLPMRLYKDVQTKQHLLKTKQKIAKFVERQFTQQPLNQAGNF